MPDSWNTPTLAKGWVELRSLALEREISGKFADLLGAWEDDAHVTEPE